MYDFQEYLEMLEYYGASTALIETESGTSCSYRELLGKVDVISQYLLNSTGPGDRLLLEPMPRIWWTSTLLAMFQTGRVAVVVDKRMSPRMITEITTRTKTKKTLTKQVLQTIPQPDTRRPLPSLDPTQEAIILFTSGTWAKPKGVRLSQQNLLQNLTDIRTHIYTPNRKELFLSILPVTHIFELMVGLLVPLASGAVVAAQDTFSPQEFQKNLQHYRPVSLVAVPKILTLLERNISRRLPKFPGFNPRVVRIGNLTPRRLNRYLAWPIRRKLSSQLQNLFVGGAPLEITTEEFFWRLGIKVWAGYGLTETAPIVAVNEARGRRPGSVGTMLPSLEYAFSPKQELLLKGPSVFLGYTGQHPRRPEDYFNTGDCGYVEKGKLFLSGRTKNLVVYPSGDKLFCEDLEKVIREITSQDDLAIVELDTQLYLVTNQEISIELSKLNQALNNHVPAYVHVTSWVKYPNQKLPRTHTLKLSRGVLKDYVQTVLTE